MKFVYKQLRSPTPVEVTGDTVFMSLYSGWPLYPSSANRNTP